MKKSFKTNALARALTGVIISGAACVDLSAAVLEEVTVIAQKREQNLQDVGISVSAFSGDQLKALGVTNTVDITQQIPGLQYNQFTPAFSIINLRGISQANFTDSLEAPVAVYVDGAYSASMNAVNAQLYDMERVEVLRGPQGTLFGRNATGGLIHYITRDASEEELNGYVELSLSEYDKRSVEWAIGGSLSDRVRARLAGRWEESDGYVESSNNLTRDAHGADGYSIRGKLQVDFSDSLRGDFVAGYAEDDDVPSGTYTVEFYPVQAPGVSFDPNTGFGLTNGAVELGGANTHDSDYQGFFNRKVADLGATFTWDISEDLEFVSITNWKDLEKEYSEDADGGQNPFSFVFSTFADFTQFSQEFRLSGSISDKTIWQVGAYYLDMEYELSDDVFDPPFPFYQFLGGPLDATFTSVDLESRNWSLFAQVEHQLSETMTLIAGLRHSQDDKEVDWVINDRLAADGSLTPNAGSLSALLPTNPGLDEIDYGDYAARLQIDWRPNEDVLVFVSANRGIKGGNWTPPITGDINVVLQHDEETLYAYEIGTKLTLGDGLARLNATAFYYDYEDYQAFSFNGNLTPQVSNSDATAYGGEIELYLSPGSGWDIMLGASFIESEVDEVPHIFGGSVTDLEFPNAPSVSLNALVRYEWSLSGEASVAMQLDGNYNSKQFLLGTNSETSEEGSYSVWNASISYTSPSERWKTTVWVKNLTDEEYRIYHIDLALAGFFEDIYAAPRWAGVNVSYSF